MMKNQQNQTLRNLAYGLLMVAIFGSCVSQSKTKIIQERVDKEMKTDYENLRSNTYRIQIGDHLYIRVYSVDAKTSKFFQSDFPYLMNSTYQYLNTFVVDEFGYISYSFIDKIYVKGLTVQEVRDAIQKQLDEYFKDATAMVKLVNFQVAVLGEVKAPGNFTIEQDQINIFQAIGLAGGLTDFGNLKEVRLVRQTANGSEVKVVDVSDNRLIESPYYYLQPNDVIYIEPRGTKSWALEKFPYTVVLSFASLLLVSYSILMK